MKLLFQHQEDAQYFADKHTNGDISALESDYLEYFDFRPVEVKRTEYLLQRHELKKQLIARDGETCSMCQKEKGEQIDHWIPLGSNELNKRTRKMQPTFVNGALKKVPKDSYGSNHLKNLKWVCKSCNRTKWHSI